MRYGAYSPALEWMRDRTHPPKRSNQMILDGGARIGGFWKNFKTRKRCAVPPYDWLLTNPVLKSDYNASSVTRGRLQNT